MGSEAIREIPEAGYNQPSGCPVLPRIPWVNNFVAKETPIRFQNRFASQGWHLQWHQKIVCVAPA